MKVVLLTTRRHIPSCISVGTFLKNTLLHKYNIEVVGIVAADMFTTKKGHLGKLKKLMKKTGFRFAFHFVLTGIFQLISLRLAKLFVADKHRRYFEMTELSERYQIPLLQVHNINTQEVIDFCQEKDPDYLISSGLLQILKTPLLDIPKEGSLNFHPSLVQEHRGIFTSFWALFHRRPTSGATVHFMTEKIDDGRIVLQRRFFVHKSDSLYSIDEKSAQMGGNMLAKALIKLKKQKDTHVRIKELSRIFSMPDRSHIQIFRRAHKKISYWRDIWKFFWR